MCKMEKICILCGKPIPESRRSGNTKYCSLACQRKAGITPEVINKIVDRNKKKSSRHPDLTIAFGSKCAVCGWQIPSWMPGYKKSVRQGGCEMHHIIPVAEGGTEDISNLVLLCPNCHKMAHVGLITTDELSKLTLTDEQIKDRVLESRLETSKILWQQFKPR